MSKWIAFLTRRIEQLTEEDSEGNLGDIVRLQRQLEALMNVRYGAVVSPALIRAMIHPESLEHGPGRPVSEPAIQYYNKELNPAQREAVAKALGAERMCLIQGPPGTGKTTVITEICLHLLLGEPKARILICSETHVAVNNVLDRLYEELDGFTPLRVDNKDDHVSDQIASASTEALLERYLNVLRSRVNGNLVDGLATILRENIRRTTRDLIRSRRVVGVTCNGIAAYGSALDMAFDYVIIDEVCKATLPEVLIPLALAKKAILVGDPAQLPPLFCYEDRDVMAETGTEEIEDYKYVDVLFQRVPEASRGMLTQQFRMTNEIGDLISHFFYEGRLENGLYRSAPGSATWVDYSPTSAWPQKFGDPIHNPDEVNIIASILDREHAQAPSARRSVAIITPYRAQMRLIRERITPDKYPNFDIAVDTVDAFQGKDADYVIFSVTRTTGSMRFFGDRRRLNVALSRAKDKLWVVGATGYTDRHDLLRRMAERMRRVNACPSSGLLVDSGFLGSGPH